jgi:hypothetical protein
MYLGKALMTAFLHKERWHAIIIILCLLGLLVPEGRSGESSPKVYVILWFDTEDYILPASDNATLRLARWLIQQGIRAVFKVVGERALSFERRKRDDVIEALKKHEIGFHARWHSVQPTPAMYLSNLDWDEGVAEFDRREKPGFDDVARIFGTKPTCYGQPGSSWGPQSYGAMKKWGMSVYLDAGSHINLNNGPCYYDGILNLYKLEHTMRADLTSPEKLKDAQDRFLRSRQKLLKEGGGIVSIYYHPCEFVHKQFWDATNFIYGANPPREEWKLPPMKTEDETRIAFEVFERYVTFIKDQPDVVFITASEAARLYRDQAIGRSFSPGELQQIAKKVTTDVTFQRRGDHALAASDIFALVNQHFLDRLDGKPQAVTSKGTFVGPTGTPRMQGPVQTSWSQFTSTAADVQDFLDKQGRIPSAVWLGSVSVTPEAYLATLAKSCCELTAGKAAPETVEVGLARLAAADHVAADDPRLWGWIIFPKGFRAPAMMELAKQQAWTLKPAILHGRRE